MDINSKLNGIATDLVLEKAMKDKLEAAEREIQRQEEQEELEQKQKREKGEDEDDDLEDLLNDEEAEKIIRKMKDARLKDFEDANEKTKVQQGRPLFPGEYREIVEEEFLPYVTKNKFAVCHFYHPDFERCKIVDKHLQLISKEHPEAKFITINSDKAPFFVNKLAIRVLPTICLFKDGILVDQIVGFEELGARDDFPTVDLARRIVKSGVIQARRREEDVAFKMNKGGKKGGNDSDDDD
eukprot:TRINITY_DN2190_c0_g1_i4.p1 TRINITY_DN2190_c0_g1~~TRINITY_DN2190_c0_g1_i4.p1  ORF type:complete len:240 (-),score=107.10 TRINITY_DN2190_c0_g1_i4:594-1313(-)